ncbi:hypothetical protein BS78_03G101400 [Paspalum vaginatum]|nr:hypothetical protein BS78_03G101400 [Paspalum vaginatum]
MSKKIVIKADLVGKACMSDILSVVATFQGIKSMTIDPDKCTLTVVGTVDPVCISLKLKKKCFATTILSVEVDPPPPPPPPKDPWKEACEKLCKEKCERIACCKECKERCEKACKERCERRCKAWLETGRCSCGPCTPGCGCGGGTCTPSYSYCYCYTNCWCGGRCGGRCGRSGWTGHFGC